MVQSAQDDVPNMFDTLTGMTRSLGTALVLNPCAYTYGFPGGSDSEASTCNAGDLGSILGLGRSPGEEMVTCSNILAWITAWTEEPGELQSMGLQSHT